uniref:Uncharacterized protein n=1 Tax=Oryza brachyantha TaxID=4533 RepID=J3MKM1_ORYBR
MVAKATMANVAASTAAMPRIVIFCCYPVILSFSLKDFRRPRKRCVAEAARWAAAAVSYAGRGRHHGPGKDDALCRVTAAATCVGWGRRWAALGGDGLRRMGAATSCAGRRQRRPVPSGGDAPGGGGASRL